MTSFCLAVRLKDKQTAHLFNETIILIKIQSLKQQRERPCICFSLSLSCEAQEEAQSSPLRKQVFFDQLVGAHFDVLGGSESWGPIGACSGKVH